MLSTVREKYLESVLSFGTFAVKYREDSSRLVPLRYPPPKPPPNKIQTEVEWVHASTKMLYRWKTLTAGGGDGFLCTDGKTVWGTGAREA